MDLPFDRLVTDSTTTVLPLPNLHFLLQQERLEVTVTSSLCLDLPSHLSSIGTIDQLSALVKESHLWIARTGSCCFDVSVSVNGDSMKEGRERDLFVRQVKRSKVRESCHCLNDWVSSLTACTVVASFASQARMRLPCLDPATGGHDLFDTPSRPGVRSAPPRWCSYIAISIGASLN